MAAKTDIYIEEAYKELEIISQDRQKRIAYTSRQKALGDYNTIMEERYNDGLEVGREEGREEGIAIGTEKGRQDLLEQLLAANVEIPIEILKSINQNNK